MTIDLVIVGGRRKADPPALLLFGCDVTDARIDAAAYLVLQPLRKLSKPRTDLGGRVQISSGLKPSYIKWEPLRLTRCP